DALRQGRSGIRRLTSIDTTELQCKIGGEVPAEAHEGKHRGFDRFTRLALIAAEDAARQSNYSSIGVEPDRVGALIGTGVGGCETLDASYRRIYKESITRVAPTTIAYTMYNAPSSAISAKLQ